MLSLFAQECESLARSLLFVCNESGHVRFERALRLIFTAGILKYRERWYITRNIEVPYIENTIYDAVCYY
jgi:hypothetical protein